MRIFSLIAVMAMVSPLLAGGEYFTVEYPPGQGQGELVFGVNYTLWVPANVKTLRGVIVHQHGCGSGACQGGATAAYDLHWQALAKKWDCALLGPSYQQADGQNCRLWCDPRNGSERAFLKCLKDFAEKSKHPELTDVPWCLWGHSGGGFWSSLMQVKFPERIVAIWCRSGTALPAWEKGDIEKPDVREGTYGVPVMLNPGLKEKGDKRFDGAWTGSLKMFNEYRQKHNAPMSFADDPRTSHECGDSRYLAILYFDACLAMRLPKTGNKLQPVDLKQGWLANIQSRELAPFEKFTGEANTATWLPSERAAKAWVEYVKTGAVSDTTPPPTPTNVQSKPVADGVEITWEAEADFESGLKQFIILNNGQEVGRVPQKPVGKFGRPLFQSMSYHDTPEKPLPTMKLVLKEKSVGKLEVVSVNSVGLRSDGK